VLCFAPFLNHSTCHSTWTQTGSLPPKKTVNLPPCINQPHFYLFNILQQLRDNFCDTRYNYLIKSDVCGYTALCCSIEDSPFSPQPHHTASPPKWAVDEDIFLRAQCENDSDDDDYTDADPVLDDLYSRRVRHTLHQTSNNPNSDRFLPRYWTPEEDTRVRTIYLGSQRRPWYRKMQGLRSVGWFYCSIKPGCADGERVEALRFTNTLFTNTRQSWSCSFVLFFSFFAKLHCLSNKHIYLEAENLAWRVTLTVTRSI